jgi:hypothetical protein
MSFFEVQEFYSIMTCKLNIHLLLCVSLADIQRRGSILAWIVTLSVYGAETIAEVKLLIPPFLR